MLMLTVLRISLGMKQCEKNPGKTFLEKHKVGDVVEGEVRNFTEFGLFVGFDSGLMVLFTPQTSSWWK